MTSVVRHLCPRRPPTADEPEQLQHLLHCRKLVNTASRQQSHCSLELVCVIKQLGQTITSSAKHQRALVDLSLRLRSSDHLVSYLPVTSRQVRVPRLLSTCPSYSQRNNRSLSHLQLAPSFVVPSRGLRLTADIPLASPYYSPVHTYA